MMPYNFTLNPVVTLTTNTDLIPVGNATTPILWATPDKIVKESLASGNYNVGIGTTLTTAKLNIANTSTTAVSNNVLLAVGNNDANFQTLVKTGPSGAGIVPVSSIGVDYGTTYIDLATIKFWRTGGAGGEIAFNTGSVANGVERMRIDSAGRVTMPYQPMFCAKHILSEALGVNGILTQWAVVTNKGGGSFSTGRYTVPKAGSYLINISIMRETPIIDSGIRLAINGVNQFRIAFVSSATALNYSMASGQAIYTLAVNDYIEFTNEVATCAYYGDSAGLGNITINLLG